MQDYEDASAEAARVQADARRKRILEKANKRMDIVSGEVVLEEGEKQASSANAARIRAARQRARRKKVTDPSEAPAENTGEETAPEEGPVSSSGDDDGAASTPSNDVPPASEEVPVPKNPAVTTEEPKSAEVADSNPAADPIPDAAEPIVSEEKEDVAGKKKYVGVAKMRRKMLLQKKQQSEATTPVSSTERSAVVLPAKPVLLINTFPIYMHIFTIVLLFLAGLDVGVQQFQHDVVVHNKDALSHYGLPLIHRNLWGNRSKDAVVEKSKLEELQRRTNDFDTPEAAIIDEFHELEEEEYVPKIDPLFGVDLDKATAGPGILNQLARGAIFIHRLILKVIFETPKTVVQTILGIPQALLNTPPILCIVALILRQFVSKKVLGASLPTAGEGVDGEKTAGGGIDVLSMMKSMATSFLANTFPTLVTLYEAFTHLRSDMYVILCGVFFGLAWSQILAAEVIGGAGGGGGNQDEL